MALAETNRSTLARLNANEAEFFYAGYEAGKALAKLAQWSDRAGELHDVLNDAGSNFLTEEIPDDECGFAFNAGMSEGWDDHVEGQ